jgi:hypothetical protein
MSPDETPNRVSKASGFAGLRELAASVSLDGPAPPQQAPKELRADPTQRPNGVRAAPTPSSPPRDQGPYQGPPARKAILTSRGKLVVGGLIAMAVIWAIADQGNNSSTSPTEPAATYTPAPEPPIEARPPVGTDIVLSNAQIRYCLSEKIRLDGAQHAVNAYSQSDVDRFNVMVDDYNNRCGSFRYMSGALEAVRAQVNANRLQLQSEGAARFQK